MTHQKAIENNSKNCRSTLMALPIGEIGRRHETMGKIRDRCRHVEGPLTGLCHIWEGPTSGSNGRGRGYPRMYLSGQTVAVHRVVYTHFYGFIPGKMQIDHKCRNRLCLNPNHLEMVTHKVNQERRDAAK